MSTRTVKTDLPLSANGKSVKFRIISGDFLHESIGHLEIYRTESGETVVNICHQSGLSPGLNGTLTHTTIPLDQKNVDLIKKSDANLPYEYEAVDTSID